jgi:hypothetical protein
VRESLPAMNVPETVRHAVLDRARQDSFRRTWTEMIPSWVGTRPTRARAFLLPCTLPPYISVGSAAVDKREIYPGTSLITWQRRGTTEIARVVSPARDRKVFRWHVRAVNLLGERPTVKVTTAFRISWSSPAWDFSQTAVLVMPSKPRSLCFLIRRVNEPALSRLLAKDRAQKAVLSPPRSLPESKYVYPSLEIPKYSGPGSCPPG